MAFTGLSRRANSFGILWRIIDAVHEDIFKGDSDGLLVSGYVLHASSKSSSGYFRLTGMSRERMSLSGALSDTARLTSVSSPNARICGDDTRGGYRHAAATDLNTV